MDLFYKASCAAEPSEIDFINGEVVQLAHHLKLPATLNSKIVDMVHEVERTGKFFSVEEVKKAFLKRILWRIKYQLKRKI